MNMHVTADPVENLLADGLKDLWFPVIPSELLGEKPLSIRRMGYKIALWRDNDGKVHALEDHCPHRGDVTWRGRNDFRPSGLRQDDVGCPFVIRGRPPFQQALLR